MQIRWGLLAFAGLLLTGCGILPETGTAEPSPASQGEVSPETPSSEEAAVPSVETPSPETAPDEPGVVRLTVWVAEGLSPSDDSPGGETLASQLAAFDDMHPDIQVEVQAKSVSGRGSALDYLRTAPPVAPSVLPDVVLLNRRALIEAAREGLILPLTDETLSAIEEDLYPAAVELGSVDDLPVGIPYLLEIHHNVYRQPLFEDEPPLAYADLLPERPIELPTYVFPAAATGGVNDDTLLGYLAAGGSLTNAEGTPFIDVTALANVLTFYEEAREGGVLDASVLQYETTSETWEAFRQGEAGLAAVSSMPYLAARDQVPDAGLASVPTIDGEPLTLVTGWSWALVASDPERSAAASTLLAWLMEPVNQGTYAQSVGYLPSQSAALAVWGDDDPYVSFANSLLDTARLPPGPVIDSTVGAAMQTAVEDVLLGRASAQEAAAAAAAEINAGVE
jgi:ABC-type glycerol-3-phosphate transport system substrate-binding protein